VGWEIGGAVSEVVVRIPVGQVSAQVTVEQFSPILLQLQRDQLPGGGVPVARGKPYEEENYGERVVVVDEYAGVDTWIGQDFRRD
jgi:hypothetical protein